jgi:hypothetical protein
LRFYLLRYTKGAGVLPYSCTDVATNQVHIAEPDEVPDAYSFASTHQSAIASSDEVPYAIADSHAVQSADGSSDEVPYAIADAHAHLRSDELPYSCSYTTPLRRWFTRM